MRYDELDELLVTSDAGDWRAVEEQTPEIWVLADDVRVSLCVDYGDAGDGSFGEPWAMAGADPNASRQGVRLCLNGEPVIHRLFAAVDGGRCAIPLPELDYDQEKGERRWHLTERQFRLGALLAGLRGHEYKRYIKQCGLAVDGRPDLGEARVYMVGNSRRQE